MGIFYEMQEVVNRTSKTLPLRFDGQDMELKPGSNFIPKVAVEFAIEQNARRGTQDLNDPTSFVSLIGIPGNKKYGDCSPIEQDEKAITRYNVEQIAEEMDLKPGELPLVKGRKPTMYDAKKGIRSNADYQVGG